jgi:hypothetical protein
MITKPMTNQVDVLNARRTAKIDATVTSVRVALERSGLAHSVPVVRELTTFIVAPTAENTTALLAAIVEYKAAVEKG